MTDTKTVDVVGDGAIDNPRKPDYDGRYLNAEYHNDGTVTIEIEES